MEQARPIEAKPDGAVEVFSAPGEGRECIEIARRVLSLARRGVPFDWIAVLLRSPEGYRAYLEEAFTRADIPVHYARGAVQPDPAGRAFYALLKCAAEGLSAQRFAEYLSLGQVPDAAPGGTPPEPAPGGVVGRNGIGKTTLFRIILAEPPESGSISLPRATRLGRVDGCQAGLKA